MLLLLLFLIFSLAPRPSKEHSFEEPSDGLKSKLFDLLRNLRLLRVFVALWNVVVLFLMIVCVLSFPFPPFPSRLCA